MSYQVIARKYRPQNFEEVVGQQAVVTTLKQAIQSGRVHHAYLFSGARGIGKTSLARIFAKALNCEQGPSPIPCNQCAQCREITSGNSLDVQEIDGASNTSVEDVRELREGLKYLPASGRYKIYIIDEVHMLSTSAFNALLKTLEEPPAHVLFCFATTESHKIPATILSRCQRFDLRRLSTDQILSTLSSICEKEKVRFDEDALLLIARESEGSLRDSQSLLDQAISYSSGEIRVAQVSEMLGLVNSQYLNRLTDEVLGKNVLGALEILKEVYERGHDLRQLMIQWLNYWRNLLVYQSTQEEKILNDLTESERQEILRQCGRVSLPALDLGFHFLYRGVEEIARSEFQKLILDVLAVRLCHLSDIKTLESILENSGSSADSSNSPPATSGQGTTQRPSSFSQKENAASVSRSSAESTQSFQTVSEEAPHPVKVSAHFSNEVEKFFSYANQKRPQLGSLVQHLEAATLDGNRLILQCEKEGIWMDLLMERKNQIVEMAADFWKRPIEVQIQNLPISVESSEVYLLKKSKSLDTKPSEKNIIHSAIQILNATIEENKA